MDISPSIMEALLMAAGATVCEVAKDATVTSVPLMEALVDGDFPGGRLYLPPGWNGSPSAPTPGTWSTISAQEAAPTVGTAVLVVPTLPAAPVSGMRVYLLRPGQVGGVLGTVGQGAPGTQPWPVTDQPATVPDALADGSAVSAGAVLFSTAYAVPSDGAVLLTVAVASSGAASALQVSWDGGTTWWTARSGAEVQPGQAVAIGVPVQAGDSIQASFAQATTLGRVRAMFAPSI